MNSSSLPLLQCNAGSNLPPLYLVYLLEQFLLGFLHLGNPGLRTCELKHCSEKRTDVLEMLK